MEDTSIAAWSRSWGRAVAAFSPGLLIAAINREARAVAAVAAGRGGVQRAATFTTALSQHCPCGARVPKTLADRVHRCAACGLLGDRDAVAAVLASFVELTAPGIPSSARVHHAAAAAALPAIRHALLVSSPGWQDTPSESTGLSAGEVDYLLRWTSTSDSVVMARRTVGLASSTTLDEIGYRRTTPDRARLRTNLSYRYDFTSYLRDSS